MKLCPRCNTEKPLSEFYKRVASSDGKDTYCKTCKRGMVDARKAANPDHVRKKNRDLYHSRPLHFKNQRLKYMYGVSLDWYDAKYAEQGGRCYICDKPKDTLVVDHNHTTGAVRALLCHNCNRGIGLIGENLDSYIKITEYLRDHDAV
jgi:hypothetical protein